MHLLIITGYWPTRENSISGIFVVQQLAALSRAGAQLTVILPKTIGRSTSHMSLQELGLNDSKIKLIEVPVLRLPEKLSSLPGAIHLNTVFFGIMTDKHIRRLRKTQEYDGCIVHGLRYAGLSIPFWHKQIGGRIAIVMHGVDPFMVEPGNQRRVRSLCDAVNAISDTIVLVGHSLQEHAASLGFSPEKLQVVHNGTDLPLANAISVKQQPLSTVRRIVSVSNLVPLKGVDDNLHALAIIANSRPDLKWEYRIIGAGPYRGVLEKLTRELGIAHRVVFMGRVAYTTTMQEMADGDVFSLPSWGEAFGIVYLEAMARGRPVIGCWRNGAQDIVTHGVDGLLVEPQDIASLSSALIQLLSNPEECSRMGRNARTTSERFTWNANAQQISQVLGLDMAQELEKNYVN